MLSALVQHLQHPACPDIVVVASWYVEGFFFLFLILSSSPPFSSLFIGEGQGSLKSLSVIGFVVKLLIMPSTDHSHVASSPIERTLEPDVGASRLALISIMS